MFASNTSAANGGANYIEDVFSTYLYTGNGTSQTITNGIDLSTKGGLVWAKSRTTAFDNFLADTARGAANYLNTNRTFAQTNNSAVFSGFTSSGFSIGSSAGVNTSADSLVSWTFRKQPKFFDVVTYTGDGTSGRTVSHNLGSVPACMFIKQTNNVRDWQVYHTSLGNTAYLSLNTTSASSTGANRWNNTDPTSTVFTLGNSIAVNETGSTYVAYLFAHNAGGFGLTGTDNVISCGSFTGQATVDLGWEPQFILYKVTNVTGDWKMVDNMRGFVVDNGSGTGDKVLKPNLSNAEAGDYVIDPTSTGFKGYESAGNTYIYIAIRRGPMKVPTSGTSVFSPNIGATDTTSVTTGFPVDLLMDHSRGFSSLNTAVLDRLRGTYGSISSSTGAESDYGTPSRFQSNTSVLPDLFGNDFVAYSFRRAPSFFDEVCYTGTGSARTVAHNLGVAPELIITKKRSATESWWTWCTNAPNSTNGSYANALNATWAYDNQGTSIWGSPVSRTATGFSVGSVQEINGSGVTYVAYLFATCAGVSKCTAFTGTGTLQTINCGFTAGSRFVLIKRTDAAGDWYVWDSSRGLSSSTDPYLLLNSTAAEVTSTNWVDTTATGFQVTAASGNNVNISGASYIALAIA
jgi:hypothetical protein